MDTTIFLAQLWGPILLAIGIGIILSRQYYVNIYSDIEKEPFAALIFGIVGMAAGIVHIGVHNIWSTAPQFIVSLLGWGLLSKGVVFATIPRFSAGMGKWAVGAKLLPPASLLVLVVGSYLTWFAYFS